MARESAPAFQFYPKDFLSDGRQAAMSVAEAGAYIRLLSISWLEGSIPDDVGRVAQMVGTPPGTMRKLWPAVRACFTEAGHGRLVQPRLERERQKQDAYRHQQSEKGQRAAATRWGGNRGIAERQPTHNRSVTEPVTEPQPGDNRALTERQPNANSSSSTPSVQSDTLQKESDLSHIPLLREGGTGETRHLGAGLTALQESYPQDRVTYGAATEAAYLQQLQTHPPASETHARLLAQLERHTRSHEWRVRKIVPSLERWLREGLWKRELDEAPPAPVEKDFHRPPRRGCGHTPPCATRSEHVSKQLAEARAEAEAEIAE